jgi:hypothetical protein
MHHPRPSLTPEHVERELDFAATALDRSDYTATLEHLTTARSYLNRVPTPGASEYAFVAFAASDERLDAARETVEQGRSGARQELVAALRSLRSATTQVDDGSAGAGS